MKIELFDYKDLNIVEFTPGKPDDVPASFSENSKYLHGSVFSLIQTAFSLSNPDFSYYEPMIFEGQNLIILRNHLQDHHSRLKNTSSYEEFDKYLKMQIEGIVFLNDLKTFYPNWKITWENIRDELLSVYNELIIMIDNCIDEDQVFRVKGY